jgi:rod shape determining protein RodA
MALAQFFAGKITNIDEWKTVGQSLLLTGGIVIWIILQPNLSTSIVIMVIWFAMLWISGWKTKNILIFAGVMIVLLGLFAALDFPFLADYQKARITNFINPDENARYGDTYNVDQALISIGSGSWLDRVTGRARRCNCVFSRSATMISFSRCSRTSLASSGLWLCCSC